MPLNTGNCDADLAAFVCKTWIRLYESLIYHNWPSILSRECGITNVAETLLKRWQCI